MHSILRFVALGLMLCQYAHCFYSTELIDAPVPIVFQASINSQTNQLFFDSAASTPFFLNRCIVPTKSGEPALVNEQQLGAVLVKLNKVKIGNLTLYNPEAALLDLDNVCRFLGSKIVGAVGIKAFEHKVLDFNYTQGKVNISDSVDAHKFKEYKSVKLLSDWLVPAIYIVINGKPTPFLIDTGYNGGLQINSETFTELKKSGYLTEQIAAHRILDSTGQFRNTKIYNLVRSLEPFNDIDLKHIDVSTQEGEGVRNLVGLNLLRSYNFIIDLRGGFMHFLLRNDTVVRLPAIEDALGLHFEFTDQECRIGRVRSEHQFIKEFGLKPGLRLLSAGDHPSVEPGEWSLAELYQRMLASVKADQPFKLSFTNGKAVTECILHLRKL